MTRQFERMLEEAMEDSTEMSCHWAAKAIVDNWPDLEAAWNLYCFYSNLISEEAD